MIVYRKHSLYWFPILILSLISCGGDEDGGNNGGTTISDTYYGGRFYDGLVTGMQYESGEGVQVIGDDGWYFFRKNKPITFYIGDIEIGQTAGREIITPLTLVGVNDTGNATVLNIARFLQTLDDDNDLSNGIAISADVRAAAAGKTINFEQTTSDFANDSNVISVVASLTNVRTAGQQNLISESDAETHLLSTLDSRFANTLERRFLGTSENIQTNCSNPLYNFAVEAEGDITLMSYATNATGATISGEGTFTATVEGGTIRKEMVFTNISVTYLGEMSGIANTTIYVNDDNTGLDAGTSSFTGLLDGNNISMKFASEQGKDMGSGITCDVAGESIEVEGLFLP
ncbi:MAG: hypothetical protein PVJ72_10825 [Gammaproteobacteria bacterium]|jgi:hypothetical protein